MKRAAAPATTRARDALRTTERRLIRPACAVLIVQDAALARTLAECFGPELHVQVTRSAAHACALLGGPREGASAHVDLAFVDLSLPGSGAEEVLQLLGRWPDAIRILLAQSPRTTDADLPRNRHLAHLVLCPPVSRPLVQALERAALGLPKI